MQWLLSILTWISADPAALPLEHARASAAVSVARASMERDIAETNPVPEANPQPGKEAPGGRQQPAVGSAAGLLQPGAPGVAEGCADGRCVDVPSVRKAVQRR